MARPTITVNSSTGSDTLSSGSGGTAINGSAAANSPTPDTAGTLIALDGSPDLSGVATDGTAVLWLAVFGGGGGFFPITAVDNTAAKTVTIETAVRIATSVAWAIGGKRASINSTTSRFLFGGTTAGSLTNTGIGGMGGGWTLIAEDSAALAITGSAIPVQCSGGDTNGKVTIKGNSPTSHLVIDQSANDAHFTITSSARIVFDDLQWTNTNGTKTSANALSLGASASYVANNCIFGHATNTLRSTATRTGNSPILYLNNCAVINCTSSGVGGTAANMTVIADGCDISNNGSHGINGQGATVTNSIISHNGGNGVLCAATLQARGCTVADNVANGLETSVNNAHNTNYVVGCNITGHSAGSACGIKFSGTTPHAPNVFNNVFNDNDTDASGVTLDASNQIDVDPGYVDDSSGVRDYTPTNTALQGDSLPVGLIGAGQSGSTNYRYPGAVQPPPGAGVVIHEEQTVIIPLNNTTVPLEFAMRDSAGDFITGLTPTVTLSKNGGTPASPAGAVSEVGSTGVYKVAPNATDGNTAGLLSLVATGTGAVPSRVTFNVADEVDLPTVDGSGHVTLADGSVTAAKLASDAITAAKIASGAITAAKFAAGAIDAAAVADNAIDAGAIASGAITSAKFAAGAIDAAAIADNAIDAGAIATGAITSAKFAAGAINEAAIAAGALSRTKFGVFADPSAIPAPGTDTIFTAMEWLFTRSFAETTQTASAQVQKNSAGTAIGTAPVSDNGTTFTRGKFA